MPDEIKGSGIIQFLDDLDWSFELTHQDDRCSGDAFKPETVLKWRTGDARWTFVNVSLLFNRQSFVPSGILRF